MGRDEETKRLDSVRRESGVGRTSDKGVPTVPNPSEMPARGLHMSKIEKPMHWLSVSSAS